MRQSSASVGDGLANALASPFGRVNLLSQFVSGPDCDGTWTVRVPSISVLQAQTQPQSGGDITVRARVWPWVSRENSMPHVQYRMDLLLSASSTVLGLLVDFHEDGPTYGFQTPIILW